MITWLLTAIIVLSILLVRHWYSYWTRIGFPSVKPAIPFGCLGPAVLQRQCIGEVIRDVYLQSKGAFVGIYMLFRPVLLIRDAELVKRILVTDSDHFYNRGVHFDEINDPITANLFAMKGVAWKELRAKLSPTFTTGKLKSMFTTIDEKGLQLNNYLDDLTKTGGEVFLKVPVESFIINNLASMFFGFEFNAFEDPEHDFVKIGQAFFDTSNDIRSKITFTGFFLFPELMKLFQMTLLPPKTSQFALDLVKSIVETRKADPSAIRNDFIQTIIELMADQEDGSAKLSIQSCAAQAFLFYGAGMETTSAAITFCIFELSECPEWLEKAQKEVDHFMEKRSGKILYDDLPDMKVLDMCMKEALRMYPGLPMLNRECTKEYTIPGTKQVIPKGTALIIPNFGLHMDEVYFPNPFKFDPSRFEKENASDDMPYYPLGAGPRYCLGKIIFADFN